MGLNKKEIYERIRDALGVKKLTEVAERLGLTTGAVSQWKTTGKISLDVLIKVSELSGVSIHWLVTGKGEKKDKTTITSTCIGSLLCGYSAGPSPKCKHPSGL